MSATPLAATTKQAPGNSGHAEIDGDTLAGLKNIDTESSLLFGTLSSCCAARFSVLLFGMLASLAHWMGTMGRFVVAWLDNSASLFRFEAISWLCEEGLNLFLL